MIKKHSFKLIFLILAGLLLAMPGYSGQTDQFEIYFEPFATTSNLDSMKTLEQIKEHVRAHPGQKLLIQGYADPLEVRKGSKNTVEELDKLAKSRADFVYNWLKSALGKDVPDATLRSYGGDHSSPENVGKRVLLSFYDKRTTPPALTAKAPSGKAPNVEIPEPTYHFSGLYEGEMVEHDFIIKNTGNDTLNIISVKPG